MLGVLVVQITFSGLLNKENFPFRLPLQTSAKLQTHSGEDYLIVSQDNRIDNFQDGLRLSDHFRLVLNISD